MSNAKRIASRIMGRVARIEDDTPILPVVVAGTIIDEASNLVRTAGQTECTRQDGCGCPPCALYALKNELENHLTERADAVYESDLKFAKLIRAGGDKGRDTLYGFMRHWLAAELKKSSPETFSLLPPGYGWNWRPRI